MLNRLSRRERKVLATGAAFLLCFIFFRFMIFPVLDKRNSLKQMLILKQEYLSEIIDLQRKYKTLVSRQNILGRTGAAKDAGFSLFSFLDSLAHETMIKEKIAYMKPESRVSDSGAYEISSVKLKLDGLSMKELIDFMFKIENSGSGVAISSFSVAKTAKEQKLDVVIEAQTLINSTEIKGEAA